MHKPGKIIETTKNNSMHHPNHFSLFYYSNHNLNLQLSNDIQQIKILTTEIEVHQSESSIVFD